MVVDTHLYDILGVAPDASEKDIERARKQLMRTHHPDKGGSVEKSQEINAAAEILLDANKRRIYDQVGRKGMEEGAGDDDDPFAGMRMPGMGGMPGGFPFDLFRSMGGGGFGGAFRRQTSMHAEAPPRRRVTQLLTVNLEDIYTGRTKKLNIERKRRCTACRGAADATSGFRGAPTGCLPGRAPVDCAACDGRGVKIRQLGPFVMQEPCDACGRTGKCIAAADRCPVCQGSKRVADKHVVTLEIKPGMAGGESIVCPEAGDEAADDAEPPGDVEFVVDVRDHPVFKRFNPRSADISTQLQIRLSEALGGFERVLTHLDGHEVRVRSAPGCVIQPRGNDSIQCLAGEGLPDGHGGFGQLYVAFDVQFPRCVSVSAATELKRVLEGGECPL